MNTIQQQIDLHTKDGLSIYQISKIVGIKPNSVLKNLQYHNVLRKNSGWETENKVEKFFKNQSLFTVRQKGDAPFDLVIGHEFYDVKSSSVIVDKKTGRKNFYFQLQSLKSRKAEKDFTHIDWFLLVFLDSELGNPMYKVRPSDITAKQTLTIPYSLKSKYPLQFIGFLD